MKRCLNKRRIHFCHIVSFPHLYLIDTMTYFLKNSESADSADLCCSEKKFHQTAVQCAECIKCNAYVNIRLHRFFTYIQTDRQTDENVIGTSLAINIAITDVLIQSREWKWGPITWFLADPVSCEKDRLLISEHLKVTKLQNNLEVDIACQIKQ